MTRDWRTRTQPTPDGHLVWTGPTSMGTPTIRLPRGKKITARVHIYTAHNHRPPVGKVTSHCMVPDCVHPQHLVDHADRQALYRAVAESRGRATTGGYCTNGHPWYDNAEFGRDGRRRCGACRCGGSPETNHAAIEFAMAGCAEELSRTDRLEVVRRLICLRGATHQQAADAVGRSSRTVTRWAVQHRWKKPDAA